jgi:lambda family phage portal protein
MAKDDPYTRRFLRLVDKNVIGPAGIALNVPDAQDIEALWYDWSGIGTATVTRRMSLNEAFRLAMRTKVIDGEVLIRPVMPFNNQYKFALSFIPTDCLDENDNDDTKRIRMGIEKDEWGAPVAYHVWDKNPVDWYSGGAASYGRKLRISASEIIHDYQCDAIGQSRGVPWLFAAITRLNQLGGYEEAEVVAARIAAAKLGFIIQGDGGEYQGDGYQADGARIMDAEPGSWEQLPPGSDIKSWDPQHPNASFDAFVKAMLRGIACAADVSYSSLTGDLTAVNYSSGRLGLLDERDTWSLLQQNFIEHVATPIFNQFKEALSLTNKVSYSTARLAQIQPVWRPRRWAWVDPQKEIGAATDAVALCVKSRKQIIEEQGGDAEETWSELEAETQRLKSADLIQDQKPQQQPQQTSE